MPNNPVSTVGIVLPMDFPSELYDDVNKRVSNALSSIPETWVQFAGAWNAVAYRYSACADYDASFTDSIHRFGDSPPPNERSNQEKYLFGFFVSGFAVLESMCYGLFALGFFLDPTHFSFRTDNDMRNVTPGSTKAHYYQVFPDEEITNVLSTLLHSKEFLEWKEIRNVLTHRTAPGRIFYASMGTSVRVPPTLWKTGISLGRNTTTSRRVWLSAQLTQLITETNTFVRRHFL